jgi:ABC-type phosphate/phosphonate transport system substrate-binding protein
MLRPRPLALGLAALTITLWATPSRARAQDKPASGTVKIGMVNTLFREVPPAMVQVMTPPFQALMRSQTGLEGELVTIDNAHELGKRLHEGKLELGVFHGFEFAWAQQKYPDLRPLVLAINYHRVLHACLVVRDDNPATSLAQLQGKTLAVPRNSREYCLLFLDRACLELKTEAKDFFANVVNHGSTEDALDDVLRDKVQVAVVDSVALETYEKVKPGCFARLKVLKQSAAFPSVVVAYRQGSLDATLLAKFRDGMITANQNPRGKELMTMWRLSAFEKAPDNFQQQLNAIRQAYPAPTEATGDPKK